MLQALLGSVAFADVPIRFLIRGRDVAQCFCGYGYTVKERLRYFYRGLPPIIHAQGIKPWYRENVNAVWREVSPYTAAARKYAAKMAEDTSWMEVRTRVGRFAMFLPAIPTLRGLMITAYEEAALRGKNNRITRPVWQAVSKWLGRAS